MLNQLDQENPNVILALTGTVEPLVASEFELKFKDLLVKGCETNNPRCKNTLDILKAILQLVRN